MFFNRVPFLRKQSVNRLWLRCLQSSGSEHDKRFRVLFLGRDEFSCLVLKELHAAEDVWKQIVVVTQPDIRTGRRGQDLSVSPLKELAFRLNHTVHHIPASKKDFKMWSPPEPFQTSISPLPLDYLLITASFGRILKSSTLSLFQHGRKLNVHPSLLPKYRGAAPIQWTILGDEEETGVCVAEMLGRKEGEGIDGGELWGVEKMLTPKNPDFKILRNLLGTKGGSLLVSTLRAMLEGKATPHAQPLGDKTAAPRISTDLALIDFTTMTAPQVFRLYRAIAHQRPLTTSYLTSWSLASQSETWNLIQLLELSVPPLNPPPSVPLSSIPGSFTYDRLTKCLYVRCADGCVISVTKLKPANGKGMDAVAFWNGVVAKISRAERRGEGVPDNLLTLTLKGADGQDAKDE